MPAGHRFWRDKPSFIRQRRTASLFACTLVAAMSLANSEVAHAQEEAAPSPSPVEAFPPPNLSMTRSQVSTFADLLGEPVEDVARHLRYYPRLVLIVTEAADIRRTRQKLRSR